MDRNGRNVEFLVVRLPRPLVRVAVSFPVCPRGWVGRRSWTRVLSWLMVLLDPAPPPKYKAAAASLLAAWGITVWHFHRAAWAAKINPSEHIIDILVSYLSNQLTCSLGP